jgi:predicted MFS family arabinose efflux permease
MMGSTRARNLRVRPHFFHPMNLQAYASPCPPNIVGGTFCSARRAWWAVASVAVGAFALVTSEFLPVGLLSEIAADLKVSSGTAGLMVTTPGLVAAVAAPFLTVAAGRADRRVVLLALTAMFIASNIIAALAPNFRVLLIGRFFLGVGVGGFWTFAVSVGRQLVPEHSRARATAIILAGISVGTVCGVPAGALLGGHAGWRVAFGATGGLAVVVLLAQTFFLPAVPVENVVRLRTLFGPLKLRMARAGLIVMFFVFVGHFAAYTYLEPMLRQLFGLTRGTVTSLLLLYGLVGIAGTFAGEALVARSVRVALIGTSLVLGVTILFATNFGRGPVAATAIIASWGLAFGAVPVGITTWMFEAVPDQPEAGQALLVTVAQIALALGALFGGVVVDHFGISSALNLGGVMVLGATITVVATSLPAES